MLRLKLITDPRWANLASKDLAEIFTDHAYCEQKAASHCISLIQKYPERTEMVQALAPIVTEEWGHFRLVLHEMQKRKLPLGKQRKDIYVNKLIEFQKLGCTQGQPLLENLLAFALIEARSCERFRTLSRHLPDPALRKFYHGFMISEAGHYKLFLELARMYYPKAMVKERWLAYLEQDAKIMSTIEVRGDRIH